MVDVFLRHDRGVDSRPATRTAELPEHHLVVDVRRRFGSDLRTSLCRRPFEDRELKLRAGSEVGELETAVRTTNLVARDNQVVIQPSRTLQCDPRSTVSGARER